MSRHNTNGVPQKLSIADLATQWNVSVPTAIARLRDQSAKLVCLVVCDMKHCDSGEIIGSVSAECEVSRMTWEQFANGNEVSVSTLSLLERSAVAPHALGRVELGHGAYTYFALPTPTTQILTADNVFFQEGEPMDAGTTDTQGSSSEQSAAERAEYNMRTGLYTLQEAADKFKMHGNANPLHMHERLKSAALNHELRTYADGKTTPNFYPPRDVVLNSVELDYSEAYCDDLNAWAEKHAPRLHQQYKFPSANAQSNSLPDTAQPAIASPATSSKEARNKRLLHDVTRERGCRRLILDYWDLVESEYGTNVDGRRLISAIKRHRKAEDPEMGVQKTFQNKLKELRNEGLIPEKSP